MQRYQTLVMEYRGENTTTSVGPLDGSINMAGGINLDPSRRTYIKPITCQMSTRIPNIFNYGNFNNTVIRVKRNIADPWTTINLTAGVYLTTAEITAAITASIPTWYINTLTPALDIQTNTVTDQVYIKLDSSLLVPGLGTQMCVDLSQSQIAYTLGFPAATTYTADGLYTSTQVVRMDAQGTYCDVVCSLTNCRTVNGDSKKILFSVPLTSMSGLTEFIYPVNGHLTPMIQYTGNNYISDYTINFFTQDNKTMVWMGGSKVQLVFELEQEL